jgi:Tfp pilus assembly PilM family ATPase
MIMSRLSERLERAPKDTVGLEFIGQEVRAARIKLVAGEPQLTGTEIIDSFEPSPRTSFSANSPLSKRMCSRAGSLAFHSRSTILKVLTFPAATVDELEPRLIPAMGIESAEDYRISHRVIRPAHSKQEVRVLCVAVPRKDTSLLMRFCHGGYPAPYALECAGLAAFSALTYNLGEQANSDSYGAIHFGTHETVAALFHRGAICLIRQIPFGAQQLHESVSQHLGLTLETARQIVEDPSFDVSEAVAALLPPVIKQLVISRDFIERRENCRISTFFVSGELARAAAVLAEMEPALGTQVATWDPLKGVGIENSELSEDDHWRYAVPVGSALSSLEVV